MPTTTVSGPAASLCSAAWARRAGKNRKRADLTMRNYSSHRVWATLSEIMTRRDFTLSAAGALTAAQLHAQAPELTGLSLAEAAQGIRNKTLSSVQLTEACLQRAQSLNPVINAYITIMKDPAMEQARVLDGEARAGSSGGRCTGFRWRLRTTSIRRGHGLPRRARCLTIGCRRRTRK